ncbi:hypothetical protein ACP70R_007563 [Stipagrostis hirtigluma subsp. patula]
MAAAAAGGSPETSGGRPRRRRRGRGWSRTPRRSPRQDTPASPRAPAQEQAPLSPGAEVEVRVDDDGFHGSWFEATVVDFAPARGRRSPARYTVTYAHLLADDGGALTEPFAPTHIRPRPPPPAPGAGGPPPRFAPHDIVEAFHKDGWWSGIVVAADDPSAVVTVAFPVTREVISFPPHFVRPRREYVDGEWVPSRAVVAVPPKRAVRAYEVGDKVEVGREREMYGYSWFPATVAKVVDTFSYIVEYSDLEEEEGGEKATEYLHWRYIRPAVDHCPRESEFRLGLGAPVEAYCDGAWSPGVVLSVVGDGEFEVSIAGKKDEQRVTKVVELLKPQYKWNGKYWRIVSAKRQANLRRRSMSGKSQVSPVDVTSDDDEHSHVPESGMTKKPRKEPQQLDVKLPEGSDYSSVSEMVTPLSALRHSTPQNQSIPNSTEEIVANQEILSEKTLSDDHLNTPVCGTSAGDAHDMVSIAELRKQMASARRNAQQTQARQLSAKALKVKKDVSKSKRGQKPPNQELHGENDGSNNIQLKGNIDLSSTEIICGLSVPLECQTTSQLDRQVSRHTHRGSNTKVITSKKLTKKKGSKEPHSPHILLDATSTVQQKGRKKVAGSMIDSSLVLHNTESQTQQQLNRTLEDMLNINGITNQQLYSPVPPGFESMSNGKGTDINGNLLEEELTNRNSELFSNNADTNLAKSICLMEAPTASTLSLDCQYGGRLDERSVLQSLQNAGSSECTTNTTLLRSCSVAVSSVPSHLVLSEVSDDQVPFVKKSSLWSLIEHMEVYKKVEQRPHFLPLKQFLPEFREGMALGLMVSYSNLVENVMEATIYDSLASFKENITTLGRLEDNGFDVQFLRRTLTKLLQAKSEYSNYLGERDKLKAEMVGETTSVSQIDALLGEKDKAIGELEQKLGQLRWEAQQIAKGKAEKEAKLLRLQTVDSSVVEACDDVKRKFSNSLDELRRQLLT